MSAPGSPSPGGGEASAHGERERRAPRARVMIVGAPDISIALRERLRQPPVEVANVFDAMGELTDCSAEKPIVAAIVHEDVDLGECAEAMRRIDPSVILIRAVGPATSLETRRGFDEAIRVPCDVATLEPILGRSVLAPSANGRATADRANGTGAGSGFSSPGAPAAHRTQETQETQETQATNAAPTTPEAAQSAPPATSPMPAHAAEAPNAQDGLAPAPPGAPGIVAPAPPPDFDLPVEPPAAEATAPPPIQSEALGDTDLIEAVTERERSLADTALALIRQHTGWPDVHIEAPGTLAEGPPGAARVAITAGAHDFGRLVAMAPAPAQLAPWGRWLARWMELDRAYRGYRDMAYRDELTGAWNRRYFHRFLEDAIAAAAVRRRPVTVMVFDIDDFKRFNDQFSHAAGDVILCETVALLKSVIRTCDRVCRIGGDEFAVIFADLDAPRETGSNHPESVELIARRFQKQICTLQFPKLGLEAPGTLSISAGLSSYPWDGNDPATLLGLADERALESKRKGKNDITFGPGGVSRDDDCG